jgi:hypothetical protein
MIASPKDVLRQEWYMSHHHIECQEQYTPLLYFCICFTKAKFASILEREACGSIFFEESAAIF